MRNNALASENFQNQRYLKAIRYFARALVNARNWFNSTTDATEVNTAEYYMIEIKKAIANAYLAQGELHFHASEWHQAIPIYQHLIRRGTCFAELFHRLAQCWFKLNHIEQCITMSEHAIAMDPHIAESYGLLGDVYAFFKKDRKKASHYYRHYCTLRPDNLAVYQNLSEICFSAGEAETSLTISRKSLAIQPSCQSLCFLGMALVRSNTKDSEIKSELTHQVNRYLNAKGWQKSQCYTHSKPQKSNQKLHLGYLANSFVKDHPNTKWIHQILSHHDRDSFKLTLYYTRGLNDTYTAQAKTLCDQFRHVHTLSHREIAQLIYEDQVDILIDISGWVPTEPVLSLAYKPAPVQLRYLDHPATSGVPNIDYFLTNTQLCHPDEGSTFSEQLFIMNNCYNIYHPVGLEDPISRAPLLANGYITFGTANQLTKFNDTCYSLWAKALNAVPDSRFYMMHRMFAGNEQIIIAQFEKHGIARNRIIIDTEFLPSKFGAMDIALDTYPYGGITIAYDQAYMGVPTITMGDAHRGRHGINLNHHLELTELNALDSATYISAAAALGNNPDKILDLRTTLREKLRASPFFQYAPFVSSLEDYYRKMWQQWCDH